MISVVTNTWERLRVDLAMMGYESKQGLEGSKEGDTRQATSLFFPIY